MKHPLTRRDLMRAGRRIATGASVAGLFSARPFLAQFAHFPDPLPYEGDRASVVYSTKLAQWQKGVVYKPTFTFELLNLNIDTRNAAERTVEGFGGAFSERGWTALSALHESDREEVLKELFDPYTGLRFDYCRTPVGANDYSTEAYSYDEEDADFELKHFSVSHDQNTLIDFIHAAQRHQPALKLWASPWTPPSWMKKNHFYAEAAAVPGTGTKDNGIRADQLGHEGEDMFVLEERYLQAYARYFGRFIDSYRAAGIPVGMVMPQNEFNSAQNFPSCTWTPQGLVRLLKALGPEMGKRNVVIFLGTLERGNPRLVEAVLSDPDAARYVRGLGVQWAGKNALPALSREFPALTVFQTEQECGDSRNTWDYAMYGWDLMKHYFDSGVTGYMYWNMALDTTGASAWGWKQNSLVVIDTAAKIYRYTPDFYLMKHLCHSVSVGARKLASSGTFTSCIAFRNPDGTVVVIARNNATQERLVLVTIDGQPLTLRLPGDSLATLTMRPV